MNYKLLTFLAAIFLLCQTLQAQPSERIDTRQLELYLSAARAFKGTVLFPDDYQEFRQRISSLTYSTEPESELASLYEDLGHWLEKLRQTNHYLAEPLALRDGCILIGVDQFADSTFRVADAHLRAAASAYSEQHNEDAEKRVDWALATFREAEWLTIRNDLIGRVRVFLRESADLGAESFARRSFFRTTDLLHQIEAKIRSTRRSTPALSQKSQQLLASAQQLLALSKLASKLHQSPDDIEAFVLDLNEQLGTLTEKLDVKNGHNDSPTELLEKLGDALTQLQQQNALLLDEVQQTKAKNARLQRDLVSFKSVADRENDIHEKMNQIRNTLNVEVEYSSRFLSMNVDSIDFKPNSDELDIDLQNQLLDIANGLSQFPGATFIIQFVQYQSGHPAYNDLLADQRARGIGQFLRNHLAKTDYDLHIAGISNMPTNPLEISPSKLEILIDLNPYLQSYLNPGTGASSSGQRFSE